MKTDPSSPRRIVALCVSLVLVLTAGTACDPTASSDPLSDAAAREESTDAPAPQDDTTDSTSTPSSDTGDEGSDGAVPADTLFASSASGVEESRREVVTDAERWIETWAELHANVTPAPEVPDIDFDTHRVMVVAMGARPTGGHDIDVASLSMVDGSLVVTVREIEPGPDCLTTQALTRPAMAVSVPSTDDPVVFEEETVVRSCG